METRKLSQEQIDNLFKLCEFQNVYYYDVQIELVDHMASAIEALWEIHPEMPFEEAVFQVCEQFGVDPYFNAAYQSMLPTISGDHFKGESGFDAIKEAKEKELRRKYDRLQWKYIGEFFQLPKIILTLAITFTLYFILRLSNNDIMVSYVIQCIYIVSMAVYLIFIYPKKFRLTIVDEKSFLLYDQFKTIRRSAIGTGLSAYNIVALFSNFSHKKFFSPLSNYINLELLTAFIITLFGIMIVALCVYTPQRVKEDFTREFPQFVKS